MGQRYAAQEERRAAQDAFTMFVAYTRARGALRDMSELGQQTDPLEPPGRRCGCWPMSPISF
jgi:hypothetical protein